MKFSRDFIDKVRDANNIIDVVSRYTQLKKTGAQHFGLCPFPDHREKSPSFSVSESKQLYYCFGCKKAGNIFNFVEAMMGMSFFETIEWLAKQASISIPISSYELSLGDYSKELDRKNMLAINEFASQFFFKELEKQVDQSIVKKYLSLRGLKSDTINRFCLGYAPNEWESLTKAISAREWSMKDAESLGLVRSRTEGKTGQYDVFRGRLIFPILSLEGNCLGFGGRILGEGEPKYLNSPESLLFHKGKIFYGLHETAKFIRAKDQVIVVEGYMDLLSLYQGGIQNVVAPLGTALTPIQARLLKRLTSNVVILFDGDQAGQEAAERSLPILLQAGVLPRGFTVPDNLDPDDYIRSKGAEDLKEKMASAPELMMLILERWMKGYKATSSEKIAIVDKVCPILNVIEDQRLKELYIQELSFRLSVNSDWLNKALQGSSQQKREKTKRQNFPQMSEKKRQEENQQEEKRIVLKGKLPKAEEQLVNLALLHPQYLKKIRDSHIGEKFSHPGLKEVLKRIFVFYGQMPNEFDKLTNLLIPQVDSPGILFQYLEKHLMSLDAEGIEILINDCSQMVSDHYLRAQARQLSLNLRGQSTSEQLQKLEQIMNIHLNRRHQRQEKESR